MVTILTSKTVHPRVRRLLGLFLLSGILSWGLEASADTKEGSSQPQFNVGYQVLELKYTKEGQEATLTVAVWYPTLEQPQLHHYGGPTSGNVAADAPPLTESGPYPLLVFSHGYGGGGISAVFLTEALAARGWIVACPDHHDKYSAVRIRMGPVKDCDRRSLLNEARQIAASKPGDRGKYLYRLDEMRFVLDGMLASGLFGKLIDRDRIAVGGHSFGGFAALGLSGTMEERHDPRIKAALLFSTGAGGYLYEEKEIRAVQIPSMLFMGERERNQLRGTETMWELSTKIYRNLSSPKYFLVVKGASHFSFNNNFLDSRMTGLLGGTEKQFEVIRRYSIAFLERYVAGRHDPGHVLEQNDPMLMRYDRELAR